MKKYLFWLIISALILLPSAYAYQVNDADNQLLEQLDRAVATLAITDPDTLFSLSNRITSLLTTLDVESRSYYILGHIKDFINGLPTMAYDFSVESLWVSCGWDCLAIVVCSAGDFGDTTSLLSVDVTLVNHTARVTAPYADYGNGRCQSYLFDFHDDLQLHSPGIYDIIISVDPNGLFSEVNENNNLVSGQVPLDPTTDLNNVIWFSK